MKVLANDGLAQSGVTALEAAGFEVLLTSVAQEQLESFINQENIDVLLVRSATTVRQELIDACPSMKIIGRGGVGMDNIDVQYARDKGVHVINTPAASSHSVAELVFAHLTGMARFLHDANRNMPLEGESNFKGLKKAYAKGVELKGKTLGVLGFGRIGQATAAVALRLGMKVVAFDPFMETATLDLDFFDGQSIALKIDTVSKEEVLKQADFLTLHVPAQDGYVIGASELENMKDGAFIANAARGGVIDEVALLAALDNGKLAGAALDVFETEPKPALQVLMHSKVSLTPHIGAATGEAQDRIGGELATQIITLLS
ncbi:D-2-hydroxyacid dehydrogenase [Flavicella sp.]|jgi:D-3-phosphoglycerate dehydrogenase|nr:D-2-hydroxyacid dehydrogenase [Flavicella sp.]MDA9111403.1 D-2-hydroxyacid dehydrogenase [Flavicella sp.]